MARILGKAAEQAQARMSAEVQTSDEMTAQVKHDEAKVELEKEETDGSAVTCPDCGFVAKSDFGLQAHVRKHNVEPQE